MRALLGGTFDPIHNGHLRAALDVAELLDCTVHLVPAASPPHRSAPVASPGDRLKMLELAIEGQPRFIVDSREFRRQGPSFTVDTLADLRQEVGADEPLVLLLGIDAFAGLSSWSRWTALFSLAHLGVLTRPGFEPVFEAEVAAEWHARRAPSAAALGASPAGLILPIDVAPLAISATGLRARLATGRSVDYLVPATVAHFIREQRLYENA